MLAPISFFIQIIIWIAPIIGSYVAYRQVRAPQKQESARQDLMRLGLTDAAGDLQKALEREFTARDYFWPIFYASMVTIVFYSMTHPTVIASGLWTGVLEDRIPVFTGDVNDPDHLFLIGRSLFWGWMGAYIYAFNIIWRRFMSYDLTPSVYIFVATRMALAFVFGGIVVIAFSLTPGLIASDGITLLQMTSVFVFFVGFFPGRGLDWIAATTKQFIGDGGKLANETRLSKIEGLSVWHQGRLEQQDIENVQNLATADIPLLIVATPFGVSQIIDWIDQAILMMYANDDAYPKLDDAGIRCAADFLIATDSEEGLQMLAECSGVALVRLKMLRLSLQCASNMQVVAYYRWHASTNPERVQIAEELLKYRPHRRLHVLETQELKALQELRSGQRDSQSVPALTDAAEQSSLPPA